MTDLTVIDGRFREPEEPPMVEPELIDCPFISGGSVTFEDGVLLFTGWLGVPEDGRAYRRVKVRFATPASVALRLCEDIAAALSETRHTRN